MQKVKHYGAVLAVVLALAVSGAPVVTADSGAATYTYLIAVDPLCDLDPSACPAIAMADNGDTVEVMGGGTLSIHPKSVSGGGTFVHKDPSGTVLGSGTWTAMELLSFHSYGSGAAQGLPDEFFGGKASIRVHLMADSGLEADGILQVDCVLGDQIPAAATEGIRLNVQDLINFNHEVSGFTVYILD